MRSFLLLMTLCCFAGSVHARIGENESQCNGRYGAPLTDKVTQSINQKTPLLPTGYTRSYDYHGWVIRIAYISFNGPAIKMSFRKKTNGRISDDEQTAILTANTPEGMKWERGVYTGSPLKGSAGFFGNIGSNLLGATAWKRTDGLVAVLEPMKMELYLESPTAAEILRKSAEDKEKARKAAIPAF